MVKKLRCTVESKDYVRVPDQDDGDVRLNIKVDGSKYNIFLTPSDAKKLRKQIKKALIEIEGEDDHDDQEKEEPVYIPHVGEVVEVYRNTVGHRFRIGEKVRVNYVSYYVVRAEHLDGSDWWAVGYDIRPIQNWKPKEGEKVLIVSDTFTNNGVSREFVGQIGTVIGVGYLSVQVYNEDKSDWFGFNISDLRPAE